MGDIRAGLKANLVAQLGEAEQTISAYMIKSWSPPIIWVKPVPANPINFHQAMGNGVTQLSLLVEAFCGTVDEIGGQMLLDAYLDKTGNKSVFAAIESDK